MQMLVLTLVSMLMMAAVSPVFAGTLDEVKKRGELIAGVKDAVAPFGYVDERTGQIVGFDVDMIKYVADKLGVGVQLTPVTSASRIPMLTEGEVDIVAATMTHRYSRDEIIDFTISYFLDGQMLLVPAESDVASVADLAGKRVGSVTGSSSEKTIKEVQPKAAVLTYEGYPQAFLAMVEGELDAVTTDSTILLGLKNAAANPAAWRLAGEPFTREPYGMGVCENDSDFRDAVNRILAEMWLTGDYHKIYDKWFGPDTPHYIPLKWEMTIWPF